MNNVISSFNINNLSQIVEFVKPMWTFSGWEDSFRNFYAETILRNNYFKNDLAFQIMEENQLCSAMFLQRLSDKNDFEQWLKKNSSNFDETLLGNRILGSFSGGSRFHARFFFST